MWVLAVDGRAGAGKTTLAATVAAALAADGERVGVLHMDDLYPGWSGLAAGSAALAEEVLAPLAAGRTARPRRWDWAAGRHTGVLELPPVDVLIVEGVGSGARAGARHLSALLWLEAPEEVRRARALGRDGAVFAPHWDGWARQEADYLARDGVRERADAVVRTA
ncbi:hypothetical protein CLV72_110188 [Allonocardiopsis opalescens]|uniref:Uridine kinase n=1 Tax=Allonocardiopsis opalescens TaxID=1144618 RepID=A0A2T0PUE8_9ACTN|nr:hypothetical protein CLV72_110188 [Allonocardiopsis opalescens]